MNKKEINSILNTIGSIVNKPVKINEQIENAITEFSKYINLELTENQIQTLHEIANLKLQSNVSSKQIDLTKNVEDVMSKYTPDEVFCYILERRFLPPNLSNRSIGPYFGSSNSSPTPAQSTPAYKTNSKPQPRVVKKKKEEEEKEEDVESTQDPYGALSQLSQSEIAKIQIQTEHGREYANYFSETIAPIVGRMASRIGTKMVMDNLTTNNQNDENEEELTQDPSGESTQDPYSILGQLSQSEIAKMQAQAEQDREYTGSVNEQNQNPLKKHKKKLFKISFVDKGVKKRGTAVSHKGVMRIVHNKSYFRVYDENNRDVTSQFKTSRKKSKKDKK